MGNSTNLSGDLEKGKISSLQLAFLTMTTVIATIDIFFPAYVAQDAKQDAWFSVIIATGATFVGVYIYLKLAFRYPDKTIIQYSCDILGKPLGKVVGVIYIHHITVIAGAINRDFSSLYVTVFNTEAPMYIYHIILTGLAAYTIWMGIEVLARSNDLLFLFGFGLLGLVILLKVPSLDFKNFLPVFYYGIKPSIKGSVVITGIMLDAIVALQLIPYVRDKEGIKKNTYITVIVLGMVMEGGVLAIALFGPLAEKFIFSALMYVRLTNIGDFIENLEIAIIGIWTAGVFVKLAVFYYISTLGIAQLFNLKSYKPLIIPVGILITVIATTGGDRIVNFFHVTHYIHPLIGITIGLVIPIVLLLISIIKDRLKNI